MLANPALLYVGTYSSGYLNNFYTRYYGNEYAGYLNAYDTTFAHADAYEGQTFTGTNLYERGGLLYQGGGYEKVGVTYIGELGYAPDAGYQGQAVYTIPAVTVDYTGPDGIYGDPATYTVEFAGFEVRYDLSLVYEGSLGYQDEYLRQYVSKYTGAYENIFTGGFEQIYSEDYANEFSAIYTLDYEEPYIGTYTANYIGSFSGETIQATEEETETYTLYVRVA